MDRYERIAVRILAEIHDIHPDEDDEKDEPKPTVISAPLIYVDSNLWRFH